MFVTLATTHDYSKLDLHVRPNCMRPRICQINYKMLSPKSLRDRILDLLHQDISSLDDLGGCCMALAGVR